jgi:2-keto-4-pentenoate hydratase/2-oxohepta-3-ene-1,7-dioic acid hydratase in catechol pathway
MKLLNYSSGRGTRVGYVLDGRVFDLADAARRQGLVELAEVGSVDEVLGRGLLCDALKLANAAPHVGAVDNPKVLTPVLRPQKILMVAVNYPSHGRESGVKPPPEPYFFTKFTSCLVADGEPIVLPKVSSKVDWEVELAVVIGRRAKYVERSKAFDYVAGYTVANDISFRDYQFPQRGRESPLGYNWVKGKSMDGSLPLGPWLVTMDEVPDPYSLRLMLYVNGEKRQDALAADMFFKIEELIEYVSSGITLMPGDVICTGTPAGVAAFSGAPYLKHGDIVEARIEGLGALRNPVVAEQ